MNKKTQKGGFLPLESQRTARARNRIEAPPCVDCLHREKGPFGNLSPQELASLDRAKIFSRFARGQILFQEGNPALGVHCIRSGLVKIYKIGVAGRVQILRIVGPGSLLSYRALLAEEPYEHYAEAITDVDICYIPGQAIRPLLKAPSSLYSRLVSLLMDELEDAEERLVEFSQRKSDERLSLFLLACCEKLGFADGQPVEIPLSRQEIADCIGAAPETVIRGLRRLHRKKLIRAEGRKIKILDTDRLNKWLQI